MTKLPSLVFLAVISLSGAFQTTTLTSRFGRSSSIALGSTSVNVEPTIDRRGALSAAAAVLLTSLICPQASLASNPRTILITGSNSGIGFEASKLLAERGHTIILGCRTYQKAENAIARIRADVSTGTLMAAECDLASLDSIKTFVEDLKVNQLDVVCLNAGLALNAQGKEIQRTKDGFELTGRKGSRPRIHFVTAGTSSLLTDLNISSISKQLGQIILAISILITYSYRKSIQLMGAL